MASYRTSCIVLRRIDLGESDRILTLLSREHGKLGVVAKGARKPSGRFAGASELFVHADVLLGVGRNLDVLSQCDILEAFHPLRCDLGLLARATYLCELADRSLAEREPNEAVFDLLLSAFYLLQRATANPDAIVHAFELRLMAETGYAVETGCCARCRSARRIAEFSPMLGGVVCEDCAGLRDGIALNEGAAALLALLADGEPERLLTLPREDAALAQVAKCLGRFIALHQERPIRSAEFLGLVRANERGG